jgi:hypothetical protein
MVMGKLTAGQARDLANQFHDLSVAIGDYRFGNWDSLTRADRDNLEDLQWTLMNYSSDFTSQAITLALSNLDETLSRIGRITNKARRVIKTIKTVDKVVRIAAAATVLGAAIVTGNAKSAIEAAEDAYEHASN